MKDALVLALQLCGVAGMTVFVVAVLAAPGFLSDSSSIVDMRALVTIASR